MNDGKIHWEEVEEGIALVAIENSAKKNAVTPAMLEQLVEALQQIERSGRFRVVLIRGADQVFCSGFDLSALPDSADVDDSMTDFPAAVAVDQAATALAMTDLVTIAVVEGPCMGAGAELAMCADFRIADESLKFCMPPVKLGLVYSAAGLQRFMDVVGLQVAKRLFFTADVIRSEAALRMSVVDEVDEKPWDQALLLARRVAGNAPLAVQGTKKIIRDVLATRVLTEQQSELVQEIRMRAFRSDDHEEGKLAIREKRRPVFRNC